MDDEIEKIPENQKNPRHGTTSSATPNIFTQKANIVAIYTFLLILLRMKATLGLEAMLEYLETYVKIMGKHNPSMRAAVAGALKFLSAERMYNALVKRKPQ